MPWRQRSARTHSRNRILSGTCSHWSSRTKGLIWYTVTINVTDTRHRHEHSSSSLVTVTVTVTDTRHRLQHSSSSLVTVTVTVTDTHNRHRHRHRHCHRHSSPTLATDTDTRHQHWSPSQLPKVMQNIEKNLHTRQYTPLATATCNTAAFSFQPQPGSLQARLLPVSIYNSVVCTSSHHTRSNHDDDCCQLPDVIGL